MRVDGRKKEVVVGSKLSGYVWTEPEEMSTIKLNSLLRYYAAFYFPPSTKKPTETKKK